MKMTIKECNEKRLFLNAVMPKTGNTLSIAAVVNIRTLSKNITDAMAAAGETLNEKLEELRIRHAMTGDRGELLVNGDQYMYSPDGRIALMKQSKEAVKEYEAVLIDVAPAKMAGKDIPKDLDPIVREALKGLLF